MRSPDRQWNRLSLDTFEPVVDVAQGHANELVAITHGGKAFRRKSEESDFELLDTGVGTQLREVDTFGDHWLATSVHERRYTRHQGTFSEPAVDYYAELHLGSSLDAGNWKQIVRFRVDTRALSTLVSGHHAIVSESGGETWRVNLRSGQVEDMRRDVGLIRKFQGKLVGFDLSDMEIVTSNDDGATWREASELAPHGRPVLSEDGSLWIAGVRSDKTKEEHLQNKRPFEGLLRLAPGASKWEAYDEVPEDCSGFLDLVLTDAGLLLLCEYKAYLRDQSGKWLPEKMRKL